MKTMFAGLNTLVVCLSLTGIAGAQEQAPPPEVATQAELAPSGPDLERAAYSPAGRVYAYPAGRWVYTVDRWVWVPSGATSVAIGGTPHVYLYTPGFGWGWCVSPWGWGGYRYGAWVGRPWHPHLWRGGYAVRPHAAEHGGFGHYGHRR